MYRKLQDELLAAGLDTDTPALYRAARALPCKSRFAEKAKVAVF